MNGEAEVTKVSYVLGEGGELRIELTGHPTDAIHKTRRISELILGESRWRITSAHGEISDDELLDSDMRWSIVAKRKP